MRKIIIYGGSFDPPHFGHLNAIKTALEHLEPDLFFIVPTFLNPFKDSYYFAPHSRLKWLEMLVESLENNALKVVDFEIKAQEKMPTYKTLEFLKKQYEICKNDKIYLLLGADLVESLPKWQNFESLKNSLEFVIMPRKDFEIPQHFMKLPFKEVEISATNLRQMLKNRDYLNLKKWIPPLILEHIKEESCKIEKH